MEAWEIALICIACVIVTAIATFFITRALFKKQLRANPRINEQMIRAMFMSMGRPATEKQIREVMRNVKNQSK